MSHRDKISKLLTDIGITHICRPMSIIIPSRDEYRDNKDLIEDRTSLDSYLVLEIVFSIYGGVEEILIREGDD